MVMMPELWSIGHEFDP